MKQKEAHYERFGREPLILRDELAIDRTLLANERTLLAYLRLGVALLIAGATMVHFSEEDWYFVIGAVCIPVGICCAALGAFRYLRMNRTIGVVRKQRPME